METTSTSAATGLGVTGTLAAWPARQIFALLAGLALLIGTLTVSFQWTRGSDYKVLFANLSDRDGGAVIAALSQMNIPYKFAETGGAISVPSEHLHQVRMKLASQGLPRGGAVGFELMESQKFGASQFQERLNYQRGLEGELARSIQALSAVQSARVHLALPAQSGFFRDRLKPSASVLLTLHAGRQLERSQIAGIIHLVASSVTELTPKQVSVVDQDGKLLSSEGDGPANGLDPTQLSYLRRIESDLMQRIIDIVQPIVGSGNVRAQVSADVDFTQSEATAEEYKPNQGREPQAVRSQQVLENNSRDPSAAAAQGIPGALSNQPPANPTAPINAPAQTVQAASGAATAGSGGANGRREATTNYEVDKTIKVTRSQSGVIKRLTAAVVVNHRRSVDRAGKVTLTPLTEKEMEGINALVREAIGWSKERGDTLNVMNTPFVTEEPPKAVEVPLWKNPENIALAKEAGKTLGLVLLGMVTIFGVIRPALKAIPKPRPPVNEPPAKLLNETVRDEVSLPSPNHPQMLQMARSNPDAVASVVRTWVNKDG